MNQGQRQPWQLLRPAGGLSRYDWTRSTEVGPDRRFSETLEQQEERHGREAEQARHSEIARKHANGVDREAWATDSSQTPMNRARRTHFDPRLTHGS
ncbi:hypothetical protein ACODNH_00260 (plasmid) [Haloarcula sp. NS06]|uniref:hypothetical protein n=1 Tax=Haloarcula sp. NS06 TaxID=3409688 RepID=UPI003DA704EC